MPSHSYRYLQDPKELRSRLAALGPCPRLAVDLEADSLHSYREKVCLIQITGGGQNLVVDPLRMPEALTQLRPFLESPDREKVFHGGDYDVRLLKGQAGIQVCNLFDTMIAAQLTGRERVGLAALLEEAFGIQLDKKYQRADWSARPLSPELLEYASLDTAFLLELRDRLEEELVSLGRLAWAREEFYLLEGVRPAPPRKPSCLEMKGSRRLSPRELARLQALLEVREEVARRRDRPPFRVLPNELLLSWAAEPPLQEAAVTAAAGANRSVLERLAPRVVAAIAEANHLPDADCPRHVVQQRTPLTPAQEKRLKRLKSVRQKVSTRLKLAPGLLVNSATLEHLAGAPEEAAAEALEENLKGWQLEAIGPELRQTLCAP